MFLILSLKVRIALIVFNQKDVFDAWMHCLLILNVFFAFQSQLHLGGKESRDLTCFLLTKKYLFSLNVHADHIV